MATLVYLPSSGAAPVTPSTWIFANQINPLTFAGTLARGVTALTTKLEATGTTSPTTRAMLRYVIGPLSAQSISGTVRMVIKALESNSNANAQLAMAVKIIQPSGADRAVLLAITSSDSATSPYEIPTSLATLRCWTITETQPLTLTTQSALDGDYLVIEIGFRSATTTSRNISLRYGNAAASNFAYSDGLTTDLNPWVEFSQTLGFKYSLAVQDAIHTHAADNIALVQHNIVTISDASHAHAADNIILTAHIPSIQLIIQDSNHGHGADNLALVQHNILAVADAIHGHNSDNLVLLQHNILAISNATHSHLSDNLILTAHSPLLIIQDSSHGHFADNLILTGHSPILDIQDASHTHISDNLNLIQHNILIIANANHGHNADELTLIQHNKLLIMDAIHAHLAEAIILEQHNKLVIADASHSHTADIFSIIQHNVLMIFNASHAHAADNINLFIHEGNSIELEINDASHAHMSDNLTLIYHPAHYSLTIANANHSHKADNIILSIGPLIIVSPGEIGKLDFLESLIIINSPAVIPLPSDISHLTKIKNIVYNNSLTQVQVDALLAAIYLARMSFIFNTPTLDILGNSIPSGTYQNSVSPVTGNEYKYKLQLDPDGEGFHKWVITNA